MLLLALKAEFSHRGLGAGAAYLPCLSLGFLPMDISYQSRQIKNGNTHHSQLLKHLLHSRCFSCQMFIASCEPPEVREISRFGLAGLGQGWRLISNDDQNVSELHSALEVIMPCDEIFISVAPL